MLEHVNRTAKSKQAQIAITGVAGATVLTKRRITLRIEDNDYTLFIGDSHAIWPTHQNDETEDAFERLFAFLADRPDERMPAMDVAVDDG